MNIDQKTKLDKLIQKPNLRIMAVVRDHMSGLLYAVPYLRALRQHFPQSHITLLANDFAMPILQGCPYVDQIVPFFRFQQGNGRISKFRGIVNKALTWLRLVGRVDLVIHFRDVGGETLLFSEALGRPFQVGYLQHRFNYFLDLNLGIGDVELGSRARNSRLLEAMGLPSPSTEMELWIAPKESYWAETFLKQAGWQPGEFLIIFHPGCHWGCNEWIPDRWSELGNELQKHYGGRIVITGTDDEIYLAQKIAQELLSQPIIATGQTTLPQFAALIDQASLVVSIDTAPTQICQALKKPTVILMGAGNPAWNGPLPGEPMLMLKKWDDSKDENQPCDWAAGFCHGPLCRSRLVDIQVQEVFAAVKSTLHDQKLSH